MRVSLCSDNSRFRSLLCRIVVGISAFGAIPWIVPISRASGAQTVIFGIAAITGLFALLYRPRRLTVVAEADDITVTDEDGRGTTHFSPADVVHIGLVQNGHILSHPIHSLHFTLVSSHRTFGPLFLADDAVLFIQAELDHLLAASRPPEGNH
jgi:hypothetical protein